MKERNIMLEILIKVPERFEIQLKDEQKIKLSQFTCTELNATSENKKYAIGCLWSGGFG